MKNIIVLLFVALAIYSPKSFAVEISDCVDVVEFWSEVKMTRDYVGVLEWRLQKDFADDDKRLKIFSSGETIYILGLLEFEKLARGRCQYKATDLQIENEDGDVIWESKESYLAWTIDDQNGEYSKLHINAFQPIIRKEIKDLYGKMRTVEYYNEALYLATRFKTWDDTEAHFAGSLMNFNYSDGHTNYGNVRLLIRRD